MRFSSARSQEELLNVITHSGNWITDSGFCVQLIHFHQND